MVFGAKGRPQDGHGPLGSAIAIKSDDSPAEVLRPASSFGSSGWWHSAAIGAWTYVQSEIAAPRRTYLDHPTVWVGQT